MTNLNMVKDICDRTIEFVEQVYIPDLLAVAVADVIVVAAHVVVQKRTTSTHHVLYKLLPTLNVKHMYQHTHSQTF